MKPFILFLITLGILAGQAQAQTVNAPVAPIGSAADDDDCDDDDSTVEEDDDCPAGLYLLNGGGGLGNAAIPLAVGAVALIGIVALAASGDDSTTSTVNTPVSP